MRESCTHTHEIRQTYDSWKSSDCSEAPPTLSSSIRRRLMAVEAITGTPGAGVPTDMSTQSLMLESWSDTVNKWRDQIKRSLHCTPVLYSYPRTTYISCQCSKQRTVQDATTWITGIQVALLQHNV